MCFSEDKASYSTSQPEPGTGVALWDSGTGSIDKLVQGISFSQPACPEHMLVNSQLLGTPGSSQVLLLGHVFTAFTISGCKFAIFGIQLCRIYSTKVQLCSTGDAALQYLSFQDAPLQYFEEQL